MILFLLACLNEPPPVQKHSAAPPEEDGDGDGYRTTDGDCDDQNPDIHPSAEEACDSPIDQNCDGIIPSDIDNDGFLCDDCNNNDPQVYPGAPEFCDGVDQDCNGRSDNDPVDAPFWYPDQDGDGYGDPLFEREACNAPADDYVNNGDDCNDRTANAAPGLPEVCGDGLDTNCDGLPGDCTVQGELSRMARLTGDVQGGLLGIGVANLGDLSGDGLNEVAVTIPYAPDVSSATVLYILQGPYSGENPAHLSDRGRFTGDRPFLPYDVANTGDHTGDGINDILVSDGDFATEGGGAYLLDGSWNFVGALEDLTLAHVPGIGPESAVGWQIFGEFDMDGDNQSDVAVNTYAITGQLQVYEGPLSGELDYHQDALLSLTGVGEEDFFGDQAVFADVDGNGLLDVVTSATNHIANNSIEGRVYLFRDVVGGSVTADEADTTWYGDGNSRVGLTLDIGEDASGDGYPDMWVGAYDQLAGPNTTSLRRMSMDSPAGLVSDYSPVTITTFQYPSLVVADLNLDGTDDLVIRDGETTGSTGGMIHVFFGPMGGTYSASAADAWFAGETDLSGSAIAFAGDTDGDNSMEVAVGVPDADNGTGAIVFLEFDAW